MHRLVPLAVMSVVALALAPSAHAGDWSLEAQRKQGAPGADWAKRPVGTRILLRSTSETTIPGQPAPMTNVNETRKTLTAVSTTELTFKLETRQGEGEWMALPESKEPRGPAGTFETKELGSEDVEVGGTAYPCKKIEGTTIIEGERHVATFWEHPEHGVLKTVAADGTSTMTVTRLAVEHQVGDRTVACREFQTEATHDAGSTTSTLLMSHDVPGHLVLVESKWENEAASGTSKMELVAVEVPQAAGK